MKKGKSEHDLLKQALKDLDVELRSLRTSRNQLEKKMENLSSQLGLTQSQEIKLRNEISSLMKKENEILKKRTATKDRLLSLGKKMEKIHSIERELKEV